MAELLSVEEIGRRDAAFDGAAASAYPESLLRAGVLSAGQVAVVGQDGYLFIADGANRWERQYRGELTVEPSWFDAWATVFARRQAEAEARGVLLVNLVAPEKQVLYPEARWSGAAPAGDRRPLMQLLARISPQARLAYPEEAMLAAKSRAPVYFRRNSHWTPSGCCAAVAALLAELEMTTDMGSFRFAYAAIRGTHDLTPHFLDPAPQEESGQLRPVGDVVFDNRHLELTGRHAGSRFAIRNPQVPDDRRVLVCGDSYAFDAGLTFALSAIFAEVAFVWSKGVVWELVETHGSQIVIWESAERFLATVPQT